MHLCAAIRVCSLLSLLTAVLSIPVQLHDNDGGSSLQQRPRIRLGLAAASGHEVGKTELTSLERRVNQQPGGSTLSPQQAAIAASRMDATEPWVDGPGLSAQEAAYACEAGSKKPNCVRRAMKKAKGVLKKQNGNK